MSKTEPGAATAAERRAAVADFAAALRQLRLEAGKPSFRAMAAATGAISHTTLHEAASGSRLPSWTTTKVYVLACGGREADWHQRWMAAANAASVPETAHLQADQHPTELPAVPHDLPEPSSGITSAAGDPEDSTGRIPDVTPPEPSPSRSPRRYRALTPLVALVAGAAIGAGAVLAGRSTVTVTAPAPGAPGYVARIASATGTANATSTRMPVGHAVAAGGTPSWWR